jgi:hypothetical protein
MGFFLALKAIPWRVLIAGAPAIAKAANVLLAANRPPDTPSASADDLRLLAHRVSALEAQDRANAKLLKQIADQVDALTTATEVLAARLRWLTIAASVAVVVSLVALVLALRG